MISFCVTLFNRWQNLQHLVASLQQLADPGPFELVIADFHSTDVSLRTRLAKVGFPVRIQNCPGRFNRSAGLNAAAAVASGNRIGFLDADMWLPPNFAALVQQHAYPGGCYFPICYSLHQNKPRQVHGDSIRASKGANGWWRKAGCGICAFALADWQQLGGWDEVIGKTYGREDGDLCRRAGSRLVVCRDRCEGLFHLWHPRTRW